MVQRGGAPRKRQQLGGVGVGGMAKMVRCRAVAAGVGDERGGRGHQRTDSGGHGARFAIGRRGVAAAAGTPNRPMLRDAGSRSSAAEQGAGVRGGPVGNREFIAVRFFPNTTRCRGTNGPCNTFGRVFAGGGGECFVGAVSSGPSGVGSTACLSGGFLTPQPCIRFPACVSTLASKAGAVCVRSARTDLCGGRPVMTVPTATWPSQQSLSDPAKLDQLLVGRADVIVWEDASLAFGPGMHIGDRQIDISARLGIFGQNPVNG